MDFLEQYDIAGLAKTARALKAAAQAAGCKSADASVADRPLAGISDDCLIQITEKADRSPAFCRGKGFLERTAFPATIFVKEGTPLDEVLVILANCLPAGALPGNYQDIAREVEPVEQGMPFRKAYNALVKRKEIEKAMGVKMQAEFALGLVRLGYSLERYGLMKDEIERAAHQQWHNLRKRAATGEPEQSMIRLEALLMTLQVYCGADGDALFTNVKDFLDVQGIDFRVDWNRMSQFVTGISGRLLPGVDSAWILKEALARLSGRDRQTEEAILSGSQNRESAETRVAMATAVVQVLDVKFPPLGPVQEEGLEAQTQRSAAMDAAA